MIENGYDYAIDVYTNDGKALGHVPIEVDWEPARQDVSFRAVRRGVHAADRGAAGDVTAVEPVWDPVRHEPIVAGFRVRIAGGNGDAAISGDFPLGYFKGLARLVSAGFVEQGLLKAQELFRYNVLAVKKADPPEDPPRPAFTVAEVTPPLPLQKASLAELRDRAAPSGLMAPDDPPVFVPQPVLDDAIALTKKAGANETGGILIGHLKQDTATPEIAVEVTAQIPALHTRSEVTRLTFTAETWTAVRHAIELRRRAEIMVGWWHSHSFMKELCKDCDKAPGQTCNVHSAFMSDEDVAVCRAVFPRAYSVALVISDSPCSGVLPALFGWRQGLIEERGFHVLPGV